MFDKTFDIIKNRDLQVPRLLLFNYKQLNIDEKELILLIYLLNLANILYNPKVISRDLKIDVSTVVTMMMELCEKEFIRIEMVQRAGKKAEIIKLDPLYSKLTFLVIQEEKKEDNTIFHVFEKEFGRTLSPTEFEIIGAWKDNNFSDEIIKEALKEAIYNGVSSLKYIDKILEEWNKKGIKTKEDVEKSKKQFRERKTTKKEVFDYDWLNDNEQ